MLTLAVAGADSGFRTVRVSLKNLLMPSLFLSELISVRVRLMLRSCLGQTCGQIRVSFLRYGRGLLPTHFLGRFKYRIAAKFCQLAPKPNAKSVVANRVDQARDAICQAKNLAAMRYLKRPRKWVGSSPRP